MVKRRRRGPYIGVAVLTLALGQVAATRADVTNPGSGQSIVQSPGGQTVTQPASQRIGQAVGAQTVTQGAQDTAQSVNGSQTVTQTGQCIAQTGSSQTVAQGAGAGPCAASVSVTTPAGPSGPPISTGSTSASTTGTTTGSASVTTPSGPVGPPVPPGPPQGTTGSAAITTPVGPSGPAITPVSSGTVPRAALVAATKRLAFTGFDLWKLMLGAGLLVACGAGTWRAARKLGLDATRR